jgi:hypothetical protein
MPPHCDSVDGPVVVAAQRALREDDVELVAPYVHADSEHELRQAFDLASKARVVGADAREVADRWFFETVVRLHRAGEGAVFTGLKPAGLDVGPVIPVAEHSVGSGSPDELADVLCRIVREQAERRHARVLELKEHAAESLPAAREYVEALLGLQVWSQGIYKQAVAGGR